MSGPMDEGRLASMRESADRGVPAHSVLVRDLLAAHDHWKDAAESAAEERGFAMAVAKGYRSRVQAENADCEVMGVTVAAAHAWGLANGLPHAFDVEWGFLPDEIAGVVNEIASGLSRAPLDLLEEMAAGVAS